MSRVGAMQHAIRGRDGKTPAELLDEVGLLDDRLLAAHCIHLTAEDITRIGRTGVKLAHIPVDDATGGIIAPTRALVDAGAKLTIATDNMHAVMVLLDLRCPHLVPHNDPLGTIMHIAHRHDVAHVIVEGEVVVRDGRPTREDMEEICRKGAAAAEALWPMSNFVREVGFVHQTTNLSPNRMAN
jgi:cytosine/adenosine deaminase-related metal-dependent hydrolase